jgi:hypothetical protein
VTSDSPDGLESISAEDDDEQDDEQRQQQSAAPSPAAAGQRRSDAQQPRDKILRIFSRQVSSARRRAQALHFDAVNLS